MNRLMTAIAIVTTLSIVQGCTQLSQVKEEPTMTTTTHLNAAHVEETNHSHSTTHIASHTGHENVNPSLSTSTQAKLTIAGTSIPNTPTTLQIDVQDKHGKVFTPKGDRLRTADFEIFQEKPMHLIVVSNDLEVFQHLHPTYQENGRFTVEAIFPKSGSYTLFADYKPTGNNEQVSVLKMTVPGAAPDAESISFDRSRKIGNTQAILELSQPSLSAGQDVTVTFNLKDATTAQAITDLQPYLGEVGHLVILRHSSSLTRADYIHAHALSNTPAGRVSFMTAFPKPGHYKLWGQFDRNGEIIVVDFWVAVQ